MLQLELLVWGALDGNLTPWGWESPALAAAGFSPLGFALFFARFHPFRTLHLSFLSHAYRWTLIASAPGPKCGCKDKYHPRCIVIIQDTFLTSDLASQFQPAPLVT